MSTTSYPFNQDCVTMSLGPFGAEFKAIELSRERIGAAMSAGDGEGEE